VSRDGKLTLQIISNKRYLIAVAGPTAVGKTDAAIALARHYHTVILSADSRQFYREMSIGTAKPDKEQLSAAKHYFIDNKSVTELYGAGHYERDAIELLSELFRQNKTVILVGGSGMYIDAVLNGVDEFEEVPLSVREKIIEDYKEHGLQWLQNELKQKDPAYFASADTNNPQRMMRALEVCLHTGKPYSEMIGRNKKESEFGIVRILLNTNREELYRRINERVDRMMSDGLLEEVRSLERYKDHNALKTVGYKEIFEHLEGKYSLAEAVEKIKQHTRNYAKRQLTWFRNKGEYKEFEPEDITGMIAYINSSVNG
jgi:tRNA dimethylallyltransferase